MKNFFLLLTLLLSLSAFAQPINYQGRLSDKSGANVNGTKNFALRIFDAKTGGKQIYEENVGAVDVTEGAYSFNFGETGKSVVTPTETIAFADGEKQIFNYTAKNPPVLGEIKISGGGYSWTEAGSSDATKFTATANKNSGAVSAIFLTGAPEAGENVSISYDHNSDGVMGALSRGGQAWLEIAVGGETLSPRERLVTVPFAARARIADRLKTMPHTVIEAVGDIYSRTLTYQEKWVRRKNYYLLSGSAKNIMAKVGFRLKVGTSPKCRMYLKIFRYRYNNQPPEQIGVKYSQYYNKPGTYNESIELNNIMHTGICLIEYGIEGGGRGAVNKLDFFGCALLLRE